MSQQRKPGGPRESAVERVLRDQEVLRANQELAAYFKGRRTEREARAALKIIKAFVRDRERQDVRNRPPLPRAEAAKVPKVSRRKPASITPQVNTHPRPSSESDEGTSTSPSP